MTTLSTFNLLGLRNKARRLAGVKSDDYSNTNLDVDLNTAYLQLAGILAHIEEDFFEQQNTTFDLVKNSALYSLPTDFMALKQLRLAYSTPVSASDYRVSRNYEPTDVHLVSADEENISTANPIHDITNDYVRIKPTPAAAVTNGGKMWYIAAPSSLVNTGDIPKLPVQYHELLAVYAAKEMTFKYEKWNKHDRLEKRWNGKIGELTQILADRDRDKMVRFKSALEVGRQEIMTRREL